MSVQYPHWNDYLFGATMLAFVTMFVLLLTGHREGAVWAALALLWCSMWRTGKQRDHLEKLLQERDTPEGRG